MQTNKYFVLPDPAYFEQPLHVQMPLLGDGQHLLALDERGILQAVVNVRLLFTALDYLSLGGRGVFDIHRMDSPVLSSIMKSGFLFSRERAPGGRAGPVGP